MGLKEEARALSVDDVREAVDVSDVGGEGAALDSYAVSINTSSALK